MSTNIFIVISIDISVQFMRIFSSLSASFAAFVYPGKKRGIR